MALELWNLRSGKRVHRYAYAGGGGGVAAIAASGALTPPPPPTTASRARRRQDVLLFALDHGAVGLPLLLPPQWGGRGTDDPSRAAGGRDEAATACELSQCGNFALVGHADGYVRKYNVQSGDARGTFPRRSRPRSAAGAAPAAAPGAWSAGAIDRANRKGERTTVRRPRPTAPPKKPERAPFFLPSAADAGRADAAMPSKALALPEAPPEIDAFDDEEEEEEVAAPGAADEADRAARGASLDADAASPPRPQRPPRAFAAVLAAALAGHANFDALQAYVHRLLQHHAAPLSLPRLEPAVAKLAAAQRAAAARFRALVHGTRLLDHAAATRK
ncbi:hypothetical protein JL721_2493 [Aureococcus anophagefferens]|nr:hypothetical protein JL721_2493 [Aureococcus anophagefferens]